MSSNPFPKLSGERLRQSEVRPLSLEDAENPPWRDCLLVFFLMLAISAKHIHDFVFRHAVHLKGKNEAFGNGHFLAVYFKDFRLPFLEY